MPLQKSVGYSLQADNYSVYSDGEDEDHFVPEREWPDESLPQRPASAPVAVTAPGELTDQLVKAHHIHVDILKPMGTNPCQLYESTAVENVIMQVKQGDVKCPICGAKSSSTQKLRNCLRSKHLKTPVFKCGQCGNGFGESHALKVHKEVHKKGKRHKCPSCDKTFDSVGHLNQHINVHQQPRLICQWCNKRFTEKRPYNSHQRYSCRLNPNVKPNKHKCKRCYKEFRQLEELKKHGRKFHGDPWRVFV